MESAPPPEPPPISAGDPQPPLPQDKGWSWRKTVWVVLAVVVVAPLVFGPSVIVASLLHDIFGIRVVSEGVFMLVLSIPFAFAVAFGMVRRGLRRGWHLRTAVLQAWSIAAACLITIIVLIVQAFYTARNTSQDKTVLSNARGLAAAADQYFLENGTTSVALSQLIGPTAYLKALNAVDRETYPTHFTQGATITVTGIAGARTITYAP